MRLSSVLAGVFALALAPAVGAASAAQTPLIEMMEEVVVAAKDTRCAVQGEVALSLFDRRVDTHYRPVLHALLQVVELSHAPR